MGRVIEVNAITTLYTGKKAFNAQDVACKQIGYRIKGMPWVAEVNHLPTNMGIIRVMDKNHKFVDLRDNIIGA